MGELLLTFLGDDFTGSTDAMEALAAAGVRTLLFFEPPDPAAYAGFEDIRAVGLASAARSLPTAELEGLLPEALERLRALGAPLTHYKICSTFDSSPTVGSIGRAIELARPLFPAPYVPLLVGVPQLGRYTAFGHLFARSGLDSRAYRLDRHPTMSRHPSTPMDESDLLVHLGRQTRLPIGLVDVSELTLPDDELDQAVAQAAAEHEIVLFDVLASEHLAAAGRLLWRLAEEAPPGCVVGSSGVEYALGERWKALGLVDPRPLPAPQPVDQLVCVSGSASPVGARQVAYALAHGYDEVALETAALIDPALAEAAEGTAVESALRSLSRGRSVILHTARGPQDPRIATAAEALARHGRGSAETLGGALGRILAAVLGEVDLLRAVIAGGDTAGYAVRQLGVPAVEAVAALAPGSPLCRVRAPGSPFDELELVLKGGQIGSCSYFVDVRDGHRSSARKERSC